MFSGSFKLPQYGIVSPDTTSTGAQLKIVKIITLSLALALFTVTIAAAATFTYVGLKLKKAHTSLATVIEHKNTPETIDEAALAPARDNLAAAQKVMSSPAPQILRHFPVIGENFIALETATNVSKSLVDDFAPAALASYRVVSTSQPNPTTSLVHSETIAELIPLADTLHHLTNQAKTELHQVNTANLLPPIKDKFLILREAVDKLQSSTTDAHAALHIAPHVLGVEKPNHILLVFKNNAEIRAQGGLAGAFAVVKSEHGKLQLVDYFSAQDIPETTTPVVALGEAETIYSDRLGTYIQNSTMSPDFSQTAQVVLGMYDRAQREHQVQIDTVVALDPVMLASLLDYSGPIESGVGQINSTNLTSKLLNDVYRNVESPEKMDAHFADITALFFSTVIPSLSLKDWAEVLPEAVQTHRISVWDRNTEHQQRLAQTKFSGKIPPKTTHADSFSVFLNSSTASKLSYYLHQEINVEAVCEASSGNKKKIKASYTLSYNAPPSITSFPEYLIGDGRRGVKPGNDSTLVHFYLPENSTILGIEKNGDPVESHRAMHDGREVVTLTSLSEPGERHQFTLYLDIDPHTDLAVKYSPLVSPTTVTTNTRCA